MKNRILCLVFLLGFFIGIGGFLYSFISYKKIDNQEEVLDNQEVFVSHLNNIIFTNISNSIDLGDLPPTLDKFGVNNKSFDFTIKNISGDNIQYTLKLIDDHSTVMNKMIRYKLVKNNETLGISTLRLDDVIDLGIIEGNSEINYSLTLWLDYNSDVKIGKLNKKISVEEGKITVDQSKANHPELVDNLIPVYYDEETMAYYKSDTNNNQLHPWYNYDKKLWANAITVKEAKREDYLNSMVGTRIEMKDINAFFVWIPRFNYDTELHFVTKEENAFSAFTFNNQELNGFWVSKYEAGLDEDDLCITLLATGACNNSDKKLLFKPNIPMLNRISMANLFYAIRKMEIKDNIYGFMNNGKKVNKDGTINNDSNNIDTHLIKNSEWNALVLLTKSQYGNNDILVNSTFYTGMVSKDKQDINYNISYGVMGSTTGNITGVYDLAGGRREYVMLNNYNSNIFDSKSNSGFNDLIKEYYYDNGLNELEKTMADNQKSNVINDEPVTRGGYKESGNINSYYGSSDYVDKVSLETNSRVVLCIGGQNG